MNIRTITNDLITWCKKNRIEHDIVSYEKSHPSKAQINKLYQLHPALPFLYKETNEVIVAWGAENDYEQCGLLKIHDAEECIELAESEIRMINKWTDEEILSKGHDANWWKPMIPLYRSMIKFYDEGNGDCIAISKLDHGVYYIAHDWMDWIEEEPPIIQLADSLESLITNWNSIQFACPRGLCWMSAVSDGRFVGFNKTGFATYPKP
jgi:arsenate reductase-like glutaredoxin family protein